MMPMKKSKHTESGGLSSKAGWFGLAKKVCTLMLIVVAVRMDILLNTNYIRDAVCIKVQTFFARPNQPALEESPPLSVCLDFFIIAMMMPVKKSIAIKTTSVTKAESQPH